LLIISFFGKANYVSGPNRLDSMHPEKAPVMKSAALDGSYDAGRDKAWLRRPMLPLSSDGVQIGSTPVAVPWMVPK
jgi:hypothetical protein